MHSFECLFFYEAENLSDVDWKECLTLALLHQAMYVAEITEQKRCKLTLTFSPLVG